MTDSFKLKHSCIIAMRKVDFIQSPSQIQCHLKTPGNIEKLDSSPLGILPFSAISPNISSEIDFDNQALKLPKHFLWYVMTVQHCNTVA